MEQQVRQYVFGVAGAGFVLIWTTMGLTTAVLAVAGAFVATNSQRLIETGRYRRRRPLRLRQRPALRARPLREEGDELPLVPDDPSLIINATGF